MSKKWEKAIGGASPAMREYVAAMSRDLEGRRFHADCSNLARIQAIALKAEYGADITNDFDAIPGETLAHKLVFLAAPTRGEMAFILTATDGFTISVCMTNDPVIRARLEADTKERMN